MVSSLLSSAYESAESQAPPANGTMATRTVSLASATLCLLIRKHQLDAGLVKAYAADYCGTPPSATPARTRSSPSSPTWPIGPPGIAMPCSASSIAIAQRAEVNP